MLSIQNIDLNDVLFLLSFQFLFIVSAVVDCYHRRAIRICIGTSVPYMYVCGGCVHVICAYMCVHYIPSISFTYFFCCNRCVCCFLFCFLKFM